MENQEMVFEKSSKNILSSLWEHCISLTYTYIDRLKVVHGLPKLSFIRDWRGSHSIILCKIVILTKKQTY